MKTKLEEFSAVFNLFEDDVYIRKVVWVVTWLTVPVWIVLGLDSGVGMFERAIVNLPLTWTTGLEQYSRTIYDIYGRSFHFSTYVIYGFLYVAISKHLTKLSIVKTKNVVYSILLVMLNAAIFEWTYMTLLIHYQISRSLLTWILEDFFFLSQYLLLLIFGVYGLLLLLTEKIQFNFNRKIAYYTGLTVLTFLLWIYFPLPVKQLTLNGWISRPLFPQTHYAYISPGLYAENTPLHLVNVAAKAMLALSQLTIIQSTSTRLKKKKAKRQWWWSFVHNP